MADISKINNVAIASISKLNTRTLTSNDKVIGVSTPAGGSANTFLSLVSDWGSG